MSHGFFIDENTRTHHYNYEFLLYECSRSARFGIERSNYKRPISETSDEHEIRADELCTFQKHGIQFAGTVHREFRFELKIRIRLWQRRNFEFELEEKIITIDSIRKRDLF